MQPLVLLHGAVGSASQLADLAQSLSADYQVYTTDFTGHGGRPITGQEFSMELFADDVLRFMKRENLHKVSVFGYSMGGYAALYLARHYPDKIDKVITLATKYHWDEATAAKEIQMLNPEKIEQKIPAFAQTLKDRHTPEDWKEVLKKTTDMMTALGNDNTLRQEDYALISIPVLIMLGDHDKMVGLEETVAVYKALPNARMAVLPDTQHPIEKVDTAVLAFMIRRFLS